MNESIMLIAAAVLALLVGFGLGVVWAKRRPRVATNNLGIAGAQSQDKVAGSLAITGQSAAATETEKIGRAAHEAVGLASLAMASGEEERAQFILENLMKRHHYAISEQQPWEMLFDIYHQKQDHAKADALAAAYAKVFRGKPSDFLGGKPGEDHDLAKAQSKLIQELVQRWTDADAAFTFLEQALIEAARPGRPRLTKFQASELVLLHDCALQMRVPKESAEQAKDQSKNRPAFSTFSALEERYMRLAKEVETLWPRPECKPYLESLIMDNRANRQGFPEDVLAELVFLHKVFNEITAPYAA